MYFKVQTIIYIEHRYSPSKSYYALCLWQWKKINDDKKNFDAYLQSNFLYKKLFYRTYLKNKLPVKIPFVKLE